jgi:hypothetical protein
MAFSFRSLNAFAFNSRQPMLVHSRRKGVHLVEPIGSGLGGVPSCPVRSADLAGELHDRSRESNEVY